MHPSSRESRDPEAGGRQPRTEGRRPKTESRRPKTEGRIPVSERPTPARNAIISNIRKMLLASPSFPRLCTLVLQSEGVNPNLAKTLAEQYQQKFCHPEEGAFCPTKDPGGSCDSAACPERAKRPKGASGSLPYSTASLTKHSGASMSQPQIRNCTHVKVNGIRCGSPALRGERFCYYHQRALRGVRTPPRARLHPIALIEDPQSIQFALMEVINALLRDTIDIRRAGLILRALHIAVKNIQNRNYVSGHDFGSEPVKEIPEYPTPEAPHLAGLDPATSDPEDFDTLARQRHECDLPLAAAYPPARDASTYARRRYEEKLWPYSDQTPPEMTASPTTSPRRMTREQVDAEYFGTPIPPANPVPQPTPAATTEPPRKPPTSVHRSPDPVSSPARAKQGKVNGTNTREVQAKAKRAHAG